MPKQRRPPCAGLWNTPMIHTDGTVTTCCLDEHMENRLGNIKQQNLREIWYGARLHSWRLAQIQGRFERSGPFCTRCDWQSAGAYPPEKAKAYLEWYQRSWLTREGIGTASAVEFLSGGEP